MAARTQTKLDPRTEPAPEDWQIGTIGGVVGAILFGALLAAQDPNAIQVAIPTLYGLEGGVAGTIVHLLHGIVLGVTFVMLYDAIGRADSGLVVTVAAGAGYGVVVWALLAAVLMPIWLSAVGLPAGPEVPDINTISLAGHIVYGIVLGVTYTLFGQNRR